MRRISLPILGEDMDYALGQSLANSRQARLGDRGEGEHQQHERGGQTQDGSGDVVSGFPRRLDRSDRLATEVFVRRGCRTD
jgi:hypothetical protein